MPGNFAKRYSGFFDAGVTSTYTFSLTSDDGSYLWLDGNPTAFINNSAVATMNVPCGELQTPGSHTPHLYHECERLHSRHRCAACLTLRRGGDA